MKDLRVELRFKNAVLLRAIEERFDDLRGSRGLGVVSPACKVIGISNQIAYALISLQMSPWRKNGQMIRTAAMLCEYLNMPEAELFPANLYESKFPRRMTADVESSRFISLRGREVMMLESPEGPEARMASEELKDAIRLAIGSLPDKRSRQVIEMRFGINDGIERTLGEIATVPEFNCSPQRIRQIEARALRVLRHPSLGRRLKEMIS